MKQSWTRPFHLGEADRLCNYLHAECVSRPTTFTYVRPYSDTLYSHFSVLLGLLHGVAVLTSSADWVRSSTTPALLIYCFLLHRSSSSRADVLVLMSSCGWRSRGWHSTIAFVSPNIPSPQSIESSTPGLRSTQVPSHYSGRRFSLPHPVRVLLFVPTLHQSNACCSLALLTHLLLGAHRRSPSVYSGGPPSLLHLTTHS